MADRVPGAVPQNTTRKPGASTSGNIVRVCEVMPHIVARQRLRLADDAARRLCHHHPG